MRHLVKLVNGPVDLLLFDYVPSSKQISYYEIGPQGYRLTEPLICHYQYSLDFKHVQIGEHTIPAEDFRRIQTYLTQ